MAALLVGAFRRIEFVVATDERSELCFEDGQFTLPRLHVVQFRREQRLHVLAWDRTFLAQFGDAGDLDQRDPLIARRG